MPELLLEYDKGYEVAKKQMKGFGGVLSFKINAYRNTYNKFTSDFHNGFFRFSVGIEDIININQALEK
jgi:cystathionine beta-lyase/cystathionine gamma-synthase